MFGSYHPLADKTNYRTVTETIFQGHTTIAVTSNDTSSLLNFSVVIKNKGELNFAFPVLLMRSDFEFLNSA